MQFFPLRFVHSEKNLVVRPKLDVWRGTVAKFCANSCPEVARQVVLPRSSQSSSAFVRRQKVGSFMWHIGPRSGKGLRERRTAYVRCYHDGSFECLYLCTLLSQLPVACLACHTPLATCHMPLSNSPLFAWLRIILTTFWGRAKGTHTNFIGQNFWSEPDSNEPDSCRWGVLDCQDTLQMGISSIWNTTLGFLGSSRLLVALKVAKIATVWVLLGFLRFWVFIEHALY